MYDKEFNKIFELAKDKTDAVEIILSENKSFSVKIEKQKVDSFNYADSPFTEVSKVVKSGPKLLFPITRNTADILVPIIKSIQKSLEEIIEKATIDEALEYLLSNNKEYIRLLNEYNAIKNEPWDIYPSKRDRKRAEELEEKLTQIRRAYKPKAEELVKSGQFKASYKVELLNGWVKRPLIVEVYPFKVDNPDDAIHIFLKAPMPLNDE
jgi:Mg2+ and Co2+ transporter CorA